MKTETVIITKKEYQNRIFYTVIILLAFSLFMSAVMFTAGYERGLQKQQEVTVVSK